MGNQQVSREICDTRITEVFGEGDGSITQGFHGHIPPGLTPDHEAVLLGRLPFPYSRVVKAPDNSAAQRRATAAAGSGHTVTVMRREHRQVWLRFLSIIDGGFMELVKEWNATATGHDVISFAHLFTTFLYVEECRAMDAQIDGEPVRFPDGDLARIIAIPGLRGLQDPRGTGGRVGNIARDRDAADQSVACCRTDRQQRARLVRVSCRPVARQPARYVRVHARASRRRC